MSLLLQPHALGAMTLQNRIVMAPMTRCRAVGNTPNALMAAYYGQRSDVGLIITEGTAPAPDALGYARIPGLYTREHAHEWRAVTHAAKDGGAHIFVQLMHTGRVGHPANLPAGGRLLGPSAIAAPGQMWTDSEGMQAHPAPVEMTDKDIEDAIHHFVHAATLAVAAGFDGVELHGANGYLLDQFLNVASNQRTDRWGGSVENRARLLLEVATRVGAAIGVGRVGVRLSPYGVYNGMTPDPDMDALYHHVAAGLAEIGVVYVHVLDHSGQGAPKPPQHVFDDIRTTFGGPILFCGGLDATSAGALLESGQAEFAVFGRPILANPGFAGRLESGAALNPPDYTTLYTPGEKGYTDYP